MSCSSVPKPMATKAVACPALGLRLSAPKRPTVVARVASPYSRWPTAPAADDSATSSSTAPGARLSPQVGDEYFVSDKRPIILFDGVCNMCNAGVNMVLDFDQQGAYRFAALQSEAGRKLLQRAGRHPDDISSIVVVAKDGSWIKSAAVLKIAEALTMPFPLASMFGQHLPGGFRDFVYDWVAENRYRLMGERDACRLMQPEWKDRFIY